MNQTNFFNSIRESLFGGQLSQSQTDGINTLLTEWQQAAGTDIRQLAYILGTVYHEAGKGMYPVREGFAATNQQAVQYVTDLYKRRGISRNYALPDPQTSQSYYGRGFVQITWKGNYSTFEKLLHVPLVDNPDLALKPSVSAAIAVRGMIGGLFTGKKLSDYFNANNCDWINARRIINGTDRAELIAGYAQKFHNALTQP